MRDLGQQALADPDNQVAENPFLYANGSFLIHGMQLPVCPGADLNSDGRNCEVAKVEGALPGFLVAFVCWSKQLWFNQFTCLCAHKPLTYLYLRERLVILKGSSKNPIE